MTLTPAEVISLKSFLNAYLRESPSVIYNQDTSDNWYAYYQLQPFNFKLRVKLIYYSLTGRHQFSWPAQLIINEHKNELHPSCLIGLLIQDLHYRHPNKEHDHHDFIQRYYQSCENLDSIFKLLSNDHMNRLFEDEVDFQLSENGLLSGHQMHPMPKSRVGFNKEEFRLYSPEIGDFFQLHYFLADPSIVYSDSALQDNANLIIKKYFVPDGLSDTKMIVPIHPWQAKYILKLPTIKTWLKCGLLEDIGQLGQYFTATSSIRTLYHQSCPYMIKCSLNVMITNSLRTQYPKELIRGLAAHRFWQSSIGKGLQQYYPQFYPITDPAFICLQDNKNVVHETTALLRLNPFTMTNNVTSLASLCQDHPFENKNRFTTLISIVSRNKQCSHNEAARLWFSEFLRIVIEPILWLFVHHDVALEAHQQNVLIDLKDGLPVASYYRDNQGYYVVDEALITLSTQIDPVILQSFCCGNNEFITHHFIYYLVCNSIFGVINALGTAKVIDEVSLLEYLSLFIIEKQSAWHKHYLFDSLLKRDTLPFKGNLLTRFHGLDELVAPLQQQSIYVDVANLIKRFVTSY